ncbi:MAG: TraR/DksA family transcriptional regulator [Rhodothalassiaceae bacterium]
MVQPRDPFLHRLTHLRRELERLSAGQAADGAPVDLDQTRIGRLSRNDALQVQAMSRAIAERRAQAIERIDAALERLRAGEFGFCVRCGEPIEMQRLESDPATPLCLDCARGH